jgi:tetratricopeptide (TPR) repeat protein
MMIGYEDIISIKLDSIINTWVDKSGQRRLAYYKQQLISAKISGKEDYSNIEIKVASSIRQLVIDNSKDSINNEEPKWGLLDYYSEFRYLNCFSFSQLYFVLSNYIGLKTSLVEEDYGNMISCYGREVFGSMMAFICKYAPNPHNLCMINLSNSRKLFIDINFFGVPFTIDEYYHYKSPYYIYKKRHKDTHGWFYEAGAPCPAPIYFRLYDENAVYHFVSNLHCTKGTLLYKTNNRSDAIEDFLQAILIDKTNWIAYANLGIIYFGNREFNNSLNSFMKAYKYAPMNFILLENMRNIYGQIGDRKKEKDFRKRFINIAELDLIDSYKFGDEWMRMKNYLTAMETFSLLPKAMPYGVPPQLYADLGLCYLRTNDSISAEESFRKAITLDSKLTDYINFIKTNIQ